MFPEIHSVGQMLYSMGTILNAQHVSGPLLEWSMPRWRWWWYHNRPPTRSAMPGHSHLRLRRFQFRRSHREGSCHISVVQFAFYRAIWCLSQDMAIYLPWDMMEKNPLIHWSVFGMDVQLSTIDVRILTHWGLDKMAFIFQTTFSNAFSWMKMYDIWLMLHWSLFPRVQLTIF